MDANQVKKLRVDMIVDTRHSPTKYSGFITGWAADGSRIDVSGWYLAAGGGAAIAPPDGAGVVVNLFTKECAHNANVFLEENSHADQVAGFELGVFNNKRQYSQDNQTPKHGSLIA